MCCRSHETQGARLKLRGGILLDPAPCVLHATRNHRDRACHEWNRIQDKGLRIVRHGRDRRRGTKLREADGCPRDEICNRRDPHPDGQCKRNGDGCGCGVRHPVGFHFHGGTRRPERHRLAHGVGSRSPGCALRLRRDLNPIVSARDSRVGRRPKRPTDKLSPIRIGVEILTGT